jgi:hypothetical protein
LPLGRKISPDFVRARVAVEPEFKAFIDNKKFALGKILDMICMRALEGLLSDWSCPR